MSLDNYTVEELEQVIKARKIAEFKQVENPDYNKILIMCRQYIGGRLDGTMDETNEDFEEKFFEEAMTTIFGQDIFKKLNLARIKHDN